MEDLTGKQFGPYQIVSPVGEGGMAAVYKAYQPSMERYVAVKVLPRHLADSEEFVARFKGEAHMLAQLQHPHILQVFDYGQAEGYSYIVMPLVQSGTLADLLKTRSMSLPEIRRVINQVGDALGYAHARGMIHRDVKPGNVLLDERGNCLLTDFGLARMIGSAAGRTNAGAIMGTPAYMAPEQGSAEEVDGRSDIYSLGIILYETVTGRVPYSANNQILVIMKHINEPLPLPRLFVPDISDKLERVILKVLAKNPAERYQTAEEFVQAIQQAIPIDPGAKATSRALDSVYDRLLTAKQPPQTEAMPAQETVIAAAPAVPSPAASIPQPADESGDNPLATLISYPVVETPPADLPARKDIPKWVIILGISVLVGIALVGLLFSMGYFK